MPAYHLKGDLVGIRRPTMADCDEFIAMTMSSREFHQLWVNPPKTTENFESYVHTRDGIGYDGFLICEPISGRIAGVVNMNVIVRGLFQSAYLGYYVGGAFAGRRYMTEGLRLVTRFAFTEMKLHRLEANIQPANLASIRLVRKCGFRKEGYSPRYLQIGGEWRDHERWALLADETELSTG